MSEQTWQLEQADSPVVATAIHDGHALRDEVAEHIALSDSERLHEEDPHTGVFAAVAGTYAVARRSRFEVDLNRPRDQAVYLEPGDAWGLQVWHTPPPDEVVARSLAQYDAFYTRMEQVLTRTAERHGSFVVLDVHSYNHRRGGPDAPPDPPEENPEINVGTGSLDHGRWGHVVKRFMDDLSDQEVLGRRLDVRENVRFTGGHFSAWVHERFGGVGCCLAVEMKKTFMDEHTAAVDRTRLTALRDALAGTLPGLVAELSG